MDSSNCRIVPLVDMPLEETVRESKMSQQLNMLLSPEKFIFNRDGCFNLFWNVIVFIAIQDFEMSAKSGWHINHALLLSRGLSMVALCCLVIWYTMGSQRISIL